MELDPVQGKFRMRQPHDDIISAPGRHLEFTAVEPAHQRMIPGGHKGGRGVFENVPAVMEDPAGFAVDRYGCLQGGTPERFIHALHAEANTQDGDFLTKGFDQRDRDTRVAGVLWPGADQDIIGLKAPGLGQGYFITPVHIDDQGVLHEHLYEVVGKGIVVIYY